MRNRQAQRYVHHSRRTYYWVCVVEKATGRPIIAGPYDSDTEANQFGFEKIKDGDFKVYQFNTRDKTAARDMFKHIILNESGQVADVLKRARYQVS